MISLFDPIWIFQYRTKYRNEKKQNEAHYVGFTLGDVSIPILLCGTPAIFIYSPGKLIHLLFSSSLLPDCCYTKGKVVNAHSLFHPFPLHYDYSSIHSVNINIITNYYYYYYRLTSNIFSWFHGFITGKEAEERLRHKPDGSYLVRFR